MSNPLVSVLIPAYNAADTLARAIESVRRQTYHRLEIVVVDDGSTDGTWSLLQEYDDIVAVRQQNKGPEKARNVAVAKSSGEIIAFLDADDEWHPEKIEIQMKVFERADSAGAVFSGHAFVRDSRAPFAPLAFLSGRIHRLSHQDIFLEQGRGLPLGPSGLSGRTLFQQLGGFTDGIPEHDLFARMAAAKGHILWVGLPLYVQHRRGGSLSSNATSEFSRYRKLFQYWNPKCPRGSLRTIDDETYSQVCFNHYAAIAKGFIKARDLDGAKRCVEEIRKYGTPPWAVFLAMRLPAVARLYAHAARFATEAQQRMVYTEWIRTIARRNLQLKDLVRWEDVAPLA